MAPSDEGAVTANAVTGGENDYPSVKNHRFLTAPLTKGAKAACGRMLR